MSGTMNVRFKLPAGSNENPEIRLTFAGDTKSSRIQKLDLMTSDGAKGAIQLIPGTAFNLLEVNFLTEPQPGKIHMGNFVLVKK